MFRFVTKSVTNYAKISARSLGTYKTSTGLVGLAVDPNGRETLLNISSTVLKSVSVSSHISKPGFNFSFSSNLNFLFTQRIPEESQYRKDVEKWFSYINKVANEKNDVSLKHVWFSLLFHVINLVFCCRSRLSKTRLI